MTREYRDRHTRRGVKEERKTWWMSVSGDGLCGSIFVSTFCVDVITRPTVVPVYQPHCDNIMV